MKCRFVLLLISLLSVSVAHKDNHIAINNIHDYSFEEQEIGSSSIADEGNTTTQPNIIIVFVDDMGYGDLSYAGHPTSSTPAIDKLAASGKYFTNFYVTSPVCSPSRQVL